MNDQSSLNNNKGPATCRKRRTLSGIPLRDLRKKMFRPLAALAVLGLLFAVPAEGREICPVLAPYAEEVEQAVERGLRYLIEEQQEDGSFPDSYGGSAGVVSLIGMCFLAAGHTPGRDAYGEMINRCLDYVLAQQHDNGYIATRGRSDRGMYTHHMSTLFLSEVSGMVDPQREERVREALSKAVRVILTAQDVPKDEHQDGGWRYSPTTSESDLTVSGWGVMALRSARLNGAKVPDDNMHRAIAFVRRMQHEDGSFGYRQPGDHRRVSLAGVGVLCLTLTGYHDSEAVERGRRFILENYRQLPGESFPLYGAYHTMQAAFQLGGRTWEEVGSWFYETYLPRQQEEGSWGGGSRGGRHYSTALVINSLVVPYRQLPVYQRDETVDE